jgi:hypothetical protein
MSTAGTAYGLCIRSGIDLPELPPCTGTGTLPDVHVARGQVRRVCPVLTDDGCAFWAKPREAKLFYDGVGAFHVIDGSRIVVESADGVDEREIRFFILGPAMAMLLHQRGLLPIHANAVEIDGVAVLFTGFSGRGKSTLAATLCSRGHRLVADDICPVDVSRHRPVVVPGIPQIRLLPESIRTLGESMSGPTVHPRTDKYAWRVRSGASPAPVPLERIYVISDGDDIHVQRLQPHEAFGQLVASTYPVAAHLMEADGTAKRHFSQCVSLAGRARVCRLHRPRSLARLPELAAAVEADVARATRTAMPRATSGGDVTEAAIALA